jgi:hypothetical protein
MRVRGFTTAEIAQAVMFVFEIVIRPVSSYTKVNWLWFSSRQHVLILMAPCLLFTGGDRTCGGLVEETWVVLHDTAEECCSSEYSWIDTELYAARTTHALNSKFWADKTGKCYQDSVVPTEDLSVELYDSIEDCCAFGVPWLSEGSCLAASGIAVAGLGSTS